VKDSRTITNVQVAVILINTMIGVSVLALPRLTAEKVGSGAVFVTMLGVLFATISVIIVTLLAKQVENQSFFKHTEKLIGKWLSRLFGLFVIIQFLALTSLVAREFGVMMTSTILDETPIHITIGFILIIVAITTRNSITTFAYIHFFYLPFIVLPGVLLVVLAIPDAELVRIQPFIGNDPSLWKWLEGGRTVVTLPFIQIGVFVLTMVIPHMREPNRALRGTLWGMAGVFTMVVSVVTVTIAMFGAKESADTLWPTLGVSRFVQLPADILERLDIIFIVFWMITGFTTMYSGYLLTIYFASQMFHLRSHRVLSYLALPFFFGASMISKNILHLYELMEIVGGFALIMTIGYPMLLYIVSLFRKEEGSHVR
jgi:spore germination protein